MSYSRVDEEGKDTLIFVTKEDHDRSPSSSSDDAAAAAAGGAQGAITAEGDINWDCPCLGNMTQGPCGEKFKDAFSCFVYSTSEPKGIDCVTKFQTMQDCFKQYPEVYGDDLVNDDDDDDGERADQSAASHAAAEEQHDSVSGVGATSAHTATASTVV
ncbi:Mitochondrial intermembrane space import and assembly protein 40 [Sorochytrium milnesiophthora]